MSPAVQNAKAMQPPQKDQNFSTRTIELAFGLDINNLLADFFLI
jgi:hypothetical protein